MSYTRVHGHKTGKSYVLEGAGLFLEHSIEGGEVVENPGHQSELGN